MRNLEVRSTLAENLTVGDYMIIADEAGDESYWCIELVEVDLEEGIVWVDFDKGQDSFGVGYSVDSFHPTY